MAEVFLGIGSNVGDREANCEEAVRRLESENGIRIVERSKLYRTKAVGPPQRDYINGVASIETDISPEILLDILKNIERSMGREEPAEKNLPRIIDIDILLYDDINIRTDRLEIPHPRMHEREFVLKGLAEIAPDLVHPGLGKTMAELYKEVK